MLVFRHDTDAGTLCSWPQMFFLLFIERLRSVGVGLLAGTVVTLGVLLLLGTMLSGVD